MACPRSNACWSACPATRVIIEMKFGTAALARGVVEVVRRMGAAGRVCLGSFQQDALDAVRALAPEIATSASQPEARWTLHRSWVRWPFVSTRPYVAFQVPERAGRLRVVSPGFVRAGPSRGTGGAGLGGGRGTDAIRLLAWGVDGLISDRPDITVPARDSWMKRESSKFTVHSAKCEL